MYECKYKEKCVFIIGIRIKKVWFAVLLMFRGVFVVFLLFLLLLLIYRSSSSSSNKKRKVEKFNVPVVADALNHPLLSTVVGIIARFVVLGPPNSYFVKF